MLAVGLDIKYGKRGSRKATLSVWRTYLANAADGDELRMVQEIADEICPALRQYSFVFDWRFSQAFRDNEGNPTDYPGLWLRLRDFAYKELAQNKIGSEDPELVVSAQQLC